MTNPWQFFKYHQARQHILSQKAWLLDCVTRNKNSLYGQYYNFDGIKTIADYQEVVPVIDYESLSPWIDKLNTQGNVLFSEPVVAFEKTGGSHSGGKLIPYSKTGLADFRDALLAWLADLINEYDLNKGHAYWALSPVMSKQEATINGITVGGSDALYLGEEHLSAFTQLSAVPFSVSTIQDLASWQLVTLYYLIKCHDLRLISIWSPSFLLLLLNAIREQQHHLLALFYQGGEVGWHLLSADEPSAKRLERYLDVGDTRLLWPELKVLSCWSDASSSLLAKKLQQYFPQVYLQSKGLLSTEAIITTPDTCGKNLLCLNSNFYEFIDVNEDIHLFDTLALQQTYQVVVTTNSGLYRYNTKDQVVCLGYKGVQPVLQFIGRADLISDKVGEKLTETFVTSCLSVLQQTAMLAYDAKQEGYLLLLENKPDNLENIILQVEDRLCQNPQYAYARKLNQLEPLTHRIIPHLGKQYLENYLKKGKCLGDIKPPVLLLIDWRHIFTE